MVRLGRIIGRGLAPGRFQGIRFRIGLAMAIALLPILLLAAVQTQADFREQSQQRQLDLQLAAQRSASAAKARLDSTAVLLQTLSPDTRGPVCDARLAAVADRVEGYEALVRFSATGAALCASRDAPPGNWRAGAGQSQWMQRLRAGEPWVVARAPAAASTGPALIAAIRVERPLGAWDGAMAAVLPLSSIQPDVRDPGLPMDSEAALTDESGRLLVASSGPAFAFRGGRPPEDWVAQARAGLTPVFEAVDSEGVRRVYVGSALAGRDVYVLLSAPAPGLMSWARLNPIGVFLLPLAAWLTAFAAAMFVSERLVVRWLDYLERIAAIYARGRFSVRPVQAINAPSEIRVLARTLDDLAETITLRDRSLTDSLSEKDVLMREIHHRVKNNLQIISSLLSMQQRALKDEAAKAALGDSRQRISALALIYRTLYQSEDIRHADARDFLTELVGQLVAGQGGRGPLIASSVEADSLVVDPDKLAPMALWLVEAVTNAQKHAFADRGGTLKVRFRVDGDTSVLEVEDDGAGVDATTLAGVGRTLMGAFAKQLRGEAELINLPDGGALARMTFVTPRA